MSGMWKYDYIMELLVSKEVKLLASFLGLPRLHSR